MEFSDALFSDSLMVAGVKNGRLPDLHRIFCYRSMFYTVPFLKEQFHACTILYFAELETNGNF